MKSLILFSSFLFCLSCQCFAQDMHPLQDKKLFISIAPGISFLGFDKHIRDYGKTMTINELRLGFPLLNNSFTFLFGISYGRKQSDIKEYAALRQLSIDIGTQFQYEVNERNNLFYNFGFILLTNETHQDTIKGNRFGGLFVGVGITQSLSNSIDLVSKLNFDLIPGVSSTLTSFRSTIHLGIRVYFPKVSGGGL